MHDKNSPAGFLSRLAAILCLLLVLLSCGKRDDRDNLREQNGEPDEIQTIGSDPFWRELWFYNSAGVGYDFRRTAACGSAQDVYLFQIFSFPPIEDSTATALPGGRMISPLPKSRDFPLTPN